MEWKRKNGILQTYEKDREDDVSQRLKRTRVKITAVV